MTHASDTLDLIERLRAGGKEFCVATVVRTANLTSAKAGAKAVVTADGELHGFVGGGCVTGAVRKAALEAIAAGAPRVIRIRPRDGDEDDTDIDGASLYASACPSGGTVEFFLEPMRQARKIVVCGSSPVAVALVAVAGAVGFSVIQASADGNAIPGAHEHLAGFDLAGAGLQDDDAVVVATQGKRDREALRGALASRARYVAMVGSRRKVDALRKSLAEEGAATPERLGQLRGPAGLDIGAVGPEEIALAIAAEAVACLRQAGGAAASEAAGA